MKRETLYVFSSSRALENFAFQQEGGFVPPSLTLEGFFSQCILSANGSRASMVVQKFLLMQVLRNFDFESRERAFLFFESNFLGFLETSPFLLALFKEMFASKVELGQIKQSDIYGEYEDHLGVIERIYHSYQEKLRDCGLYDFPREYEIFWDYLKCFNEIRLFVDGFLSHFEWDVLLQIAQKIPIVLQVNIDTFNLSHFAFIDSDFLPHHSYLIALADQKILEVSPHPLSTSISLTSCQTRIDECSVVIDKIQQWLKEGVDPQKIAVVLPKEDFAEFLQACDEGKNFNYAMGKDLDGGIFEKIEKLFTDEHQTILEIFGYIKQTIKESYLTHRTQMKLLEILATFEHNLAFLEGLEKREILQLFLSEAKEIKEDDRHGGKVRVMGMLETRGVEFEKVLIVDFNQDNIPLLSYQDMFLNTQVRQNVGMPTIKDKQNLQKHYYLELFKHSKEVEIVFLENKLSPFLQEIGLEYKIHHNHRTLFPQAKEINYLEDEIKAKIDRDFIFSSSSLKIFQECKRKFYFQYLMKLKSEEQSDAMSIGREIHYLLYETYKEAQDLREVKSIFERKIFDAQEKADRAKIKMQLALIARQMQKFWKYELQNLPDEILFLEHQFNFEWRGNCFGGRIDRVDQKDCIIRVIDYKLSDRQKKDHLQGTLYFLYLQNLFSHLDIEVHLSYLQSGEMFKIDVKRGEDELESLMEEIRKEEKFEKVTSYSLCRACPYKILCNR
ncbi:PD-(D/E)XK nuclease family protein [Helicobacter kayseriensis]|uniref:PD-(D/E)XK nuclease family protein n=1 Tax=Helicobacter kayseriensis TaxID=2905877 RepID=UPI001E563726|nr:PD-(D/E)XK nuclease family protein [Helicobacter kayseriensis]MCE3046712.1 PD-(D/E)XK nuclease family protein [Helicobacter kayseriensis]MCE3047986.1 PD-(D/E)XK nuclease family protein [Helicobacter kayseriensis]